MTFCDEVRIEYDDLWQASFNHPFIKNITTGKLSEETFKFHVKQDSYSRETAWEQQQWTIDTEQLVVSQL